MCESPNGELLNFFHAPPRKILVFKRCVGISANLFADLAILLLYNANIRMSSTHYQKIIKTPDRNIYQVFLFEVKLSGTKRPDYSNLW
jgi:hypothetical protein